MEVDVTRYDPQEAATLVRAVVDAYMKEVVKANGTRSGSGSTSWTEHTWKRRRRSAASGKI